MNLENKASGIIFAVGQNSSMPPENDNRCNGCPLWNSTAFFLAHRSRAVAFPYRMLPAGQLQLSFVS